MRIEGSGSTLEMLRPEPLAVKAGPIKPEVTEVSPDKAQQASFLGAMRKFELIARLEETPPPASLVGARTLTDEQARKAAEDIIKANGGPDRLNVDGVAAALKKQAQENPADADAITRSVLSKINEDDRDEVAQQFVESYSDAELIELARSKEGKDLLNRMLQPLLSGDVHDDERATAERVFKAFRGGHDGPVFSAAPDYTFGPQDNPALNPDIPVNFHSDNGQEVAAAVIKYSENSDRVATQASLVAQVLEKHKDDPTFLRDFFSTLGPERTAETFRHIASYGYGKQFGVEDQKVAIQNAADALSTMVKEGVFSQRDMERLVDQLSKQTPGGNFYFSTEVLGKASPEVNQMFYEAAKNWALDHPQSREANVMMAHAAQALSNTPYQFQMQQLAELQKAGKLGDFVRMAARGEAQFGHVNNLEDFVRTGQYYASDQGKAATLTGLSDLMFNAAFAHHDEFSSISTADARAIQTEMFNASVGLLGSDAAVKEHYRTNPAFKDALSALFTENYDKIIESRVGSNGYGLTSDGLRSLKTFFQEVLFSPPLGDRAASTAAFFKNKVGEVMSDVDTLSDQKFVEKYGRNKHDMASLMGQQFGVMVSALKQSLTNIKDKSEAEVKGLVDVLNGLISVGEAAAGAGGLAAATGSAIVGEALKLALGEVGGKIAEGKLAEAVQYLKENGVDVSKFDGFAFNDVLVTVKHREAHDSFRDAYDYAKNLIS